MRGLKDKVAIVTASTDGIGLAIAERLLEEGCKVAVSSRRADNVAAALKKLALKGFGDDVVLGQPCHAANKDQIVALVKKTVEKFGRIDILVSNAGVSPAPGPVLKMSESQWDKIFEINVKSAWLLSQQVVPYMKPGSSIVFVSSIAAFRPLPPLSLYGVSKTALLGLTKALATELGPQGIRVNCLAPGTIVTKMSELLWNDTPMTKGLREETALKRFGETHEMAAVTAFLCSDEASYLTGENIAATGGMMSRL